MKTKARTIRLTTKFLQSFAFVMGLTYSLAGHSAIIGYLSYNDGDAYVSDSLNDLEWMHFEASGANGTVGSLLSSFSDTSSELYGFSLADTTFADKFLDAAFGINDYDTAYTGDPTLTHVAGIDATAFTATMGDAYNFNSNNIWKFYKDTAGPDIATYMWTQDSRTNGAVYQYGRSIYEFDPDLFVGTMSWLAYRPTVDVPEPNTLAMIVLGIAGFSLRKFIVQLRR